MTTTLNMRTEADGQLCFWCIRCMTENVYHD